MMSRCSIYCSIAARTSKRAAAMLVQFTPIREVSFGSAAYACRPSAASLVLDAEPLRTCFRSASRNPSGIRSPPSTARVMKPFKARSDNRVHDGSRNSEIEGRLMEIGLSLAMTPTRPSPTFQAASGHLRYSASETRLKSNTVPGSLIRCAIH